MPEESIVGTSSNKKFFFDFEFWSKPSSHQLIPLSLGIVGDAGFEYYCTFPWTFTCGADTDQWLRDNVFSTINNHNPVLFSSEFLIAALGDVPTMWAYVGSADTAVWHMLFGGIVNMPKSWSYCTMDIALPLKMLGLTTKHFRTDETNGMQHNAFDDAQFNKYVYDQLYRVASDTTIIINDPNTNNPKVMSTALLLERSEFRSIPGIVPKREALRMLLDHIPR